MPDINSQSLFIIHSWNRYQYVALIDLDEFIIPRYNDTLNDLLT